MKSAPSLTWFFIAIAAVLVGGFAWLEFHQHGKAVPAEAIASTWQPPKVQKRQSLSVAPTKGSTSRSAKIAKPAKRVAMATSSSPAPKKPRSIADELPPPAPPERNYDDIPPTEQEPELEPVPGQMPIEPEEGSFEELDSEDINAEKAAPEKLSMKGFGGEMNKLPENLQKEFDELSEEHGDEPGSSPELATKSDEPTTKSPEPTKSPAKTKATDGSQEPGGHGQDAGDGTETGEIDPSSQRPPE